MASRVDGLRLEAHAKINLTLEILGKRDDGYHDIVSIMQTVDLHDGITIRPSDEITLECDDGSLANDGNIALKAAHALRELAGVRRGAAISITKRIPVAAGLGGGSSDAATVLRGLNELWGLDLGADELERVALQVGSDVPFFLTGGTALVQGRGEHVVPLPPAEIDWLVILTPDVPEEIAERKTAALYGRVTPVDYTRGALSHKLAGRIRGGGDTPAQFFFNAFEPHAEDVFPGIGRHRETFERLGGRSILLSGAGPSMFALAPSREVGLAWQLMLERQHGMRAFLVRRWTPGRGAGVRQPPAAGHSHRSGAG